MSTRKTFMDDVLEFHRLMGLRSFWDKPETGQQAIMGLLHSYFNAAPDVNGANINFAFTNAINEFDRRQELFYRASLYRVV